MASSSLFFADALGLDLDEDERGYFQMRLIRRVEETLLGLFSQNRVFGTTHTCIGQEADAVAVMAAIDRERDMVWSNHRCHGHFLAYCGHVEGLLAEVMGRTTGVCGGRGGSQHMHWHNFSSTGIQGGFAPVAVGAAVAERETGAVSVVFLGDGTMGEGVVYESLNMAALWSAPVVFVIEDNGIAQTTPITRGVAGSVTHRAEPFGIRTFHHRGTDIRLLAPVARAAVDHARSGAGPAWLHIETVRLGPHSKGDDTRPAAEVAALAADDPLGLHAPRITRRAELDARVEHMVAAALARAEEAPLACG